jgi:hypothetical protein
MFRAEIFSASMQNFVQPGSIIAAESGCARDGAKHDTIGET